MKPLNINRTLSLLFFIGVVTVAVAFNATKPRVMILHSYHPDYPWTRDIDIGIRRISKEWSDYALTWHYMDTKKHVDKEWLNFAGIGARRAIDRFDPDVLIAVDDLAQKLAAQHYVNHPHMQIVFSGVNGTVDSYGYDQANNVSGIYERKPLHAVKAMIMDLEAAQPNPKPHPKILYLMDPSPSMARDRTLTEAYDWSPIEFHGSYVAQDYADWQQKVLTLSELGIDYVLIANYRKLPRSNTQKQTPPPQETMSWTEQNAPIPVIGVNVFNVEDGGAIAVGASPFEQGEVAARMAQNLLKGEKKHNMVMNRQYVVAINQHALNERQLSLPPIYETFARTTATFIGEQ